jgi:hypothetical protein
VEDRARTINRLQKILESCNIKLGSSVASIVGKTSLALLNLAIEDREVTLSEIEANKSKRMKATCEEILESLKGILTFASRDLIQELLRTIKIQDEQVERMHGLINKHRSDIYEKAAAVLEEIPGIGGTSANIIIAEIGVNMDRFPTADHLCSWAGVSPGNNESAGKRASSRTNKGDRYLKPALIQCALAAVKNKNSFMYARYQHLMIRLGKKKAIMAVARSMLVAIYHVLKGNKYVDLGADYYNTFNKKKKINSCFKRLEKLGFKIPTSTVERLMDENRIA